MHNKQLGNSGEQLACNFLIQKQFNILHTNWRFSRYEIDIIATKNNTIHFIEVKTRSNNKYGYGIESITKNKLDNIKTAAVEFIEQFIEYKKMNIRYDAITIDLQNTPYHITFIEDLF